MTPLLGKDKPFGKVAIIGGTGTLGKATTRFIREHSPETKITVISRDEQKQAQCKREFPGVKYAIGDIRSGPDALWPHLRGQDVVFLFAAMKHVDIVEDNPYEAYKTNVEGVYNVLTTLGSDTKRLVFSSTDKAVDPINAYGNTKALAESLLFNHNLKPTVRCAVYRWGNVLGSHGSVIPLIVDCMFNGKPIPITSKDMTRFWIPIEWAVQYMMGSFYDAKLFEAMVPPNMKAARLPDIIKAVSRVLANIEYKSTIVGLRKGEKIHEVMYSSHAVECDEAMRSSETAPTYSDDELFEMLKPIVADCILVGAK